MLDAALFAVASFLFVGTFLAMNHRDLISTARVADYILAGHGLDLYDAALQSMSERLVGYLPSTYFVFAAWDLPLALFSGNQPYYLTNMRASMPGVGIYWTKLLPVGVYFVTALLVGDILRLRGVGEKVRRVAMLFWLTSPLSFFSQFAVGQFDIFYVALALAGIDLYLRDRTLLGSLLFGLSFTFKYFPFIVFAPAVLYLFRDRPLEVLKHVLISLLPLLIELAIFLPSPGFRVVALSAQSGTAGYLSNFLRGPIALGEDVSAAAILWILLTLVACMLPRKGSPGTILYLGIAATTVFALFVRWNPYWILFPASFLALLPFLSNPDREQLRVFAGLEVLITFFFAAYQFVWWQGTMDIQMFRHVPLFRGFNPATPEASVGPSYFFLLGGRLDAHTATTLYFSGFFAAWLAAILYGAWRVWESGRDTLPVQASEPASEEGALRLTLVRFICGALIILLPLTIAYFFGQTIQERFVGIESMAFNAGF